jgi:ParB-like chromosome segregation protein Spo0J
VSTWVGDERRSPDSILARAAVSAKQEAESLQAALAGIPGMRFRRRARLSRSLTDARRREREALAMLRGQSTAPAEDNVETPPAGFEPAT